MASDEVAAVSALPKTLPDTFEGNADMNVIVKITVLAALSGLAACGQSKTSDGDQPAASVEKRVPETHSGSGTIEKISGLEVTIAHGPIASLGWSSMTMGFAADGPKQLSGLKAGDRITFSFVQDTAGARLTAISKR